MKPSLLRFSQEGFKMPFPNAIGNTNYGVWGPIAKNVSDLAAFYQNFLDENVDRLAL